MTKQSKADKREEKKIRIFIPREIYSELVNALIESGKEKGATLSFADFFDFNSNNKSLTRTINESKEYILTLFNDSEDNNIVDDSWHVYTDAYKAAKKEAGKANVPTIDHYLSMVALAWLRSYKKSLIKAA